jgi:hypothetical protein
MAVCSRLLVRPDRVPRAGAGRVVVSSAELCKALVRESFKFGQQIANSSSAALMQVSRLRSRDCVLRAAPLLCGRQCKP